MLYTEKPNQQTSCWKQNKPGDSETVSLKSWKKERKRKKEKKEGQKVKDGKKERTGRSRHNTIPRKTFQK